MLRLANDEEKEAEHAEVPQPSYESKHKRQSLAQEDSEDEEESREDSNERFDADAEIEKELSFDA